MHASIDLQRVVKGLLSDGRHTTKSLAEAIGVSQPTVSRLATGRIRDIGSAAAFRLVQLAGGTVLAPGVAQQADEARDAA